MEFNKNGEINRYYELDDILKLDIPENIKDNFKNLFNKNVFWDNNGSCKVGKLIGIEKNSILSEIYYMTEVDNVKNFVPIWKSITKL